MNKKVFALLISILIPFQAFAFSDTSSHKFSKSIELISDLEIVSGYADGTYQPEKTVNRAEAIKIIIESIYEPEQFEEYEKQSCFLDIEGNKWYTKYICFAKEKNIIQGYPDKTFKPNQEVTFVEILKITLEAFNFEKAEDEVWFKPYVDAASQNNLIPLDVTSFSQKFNRGQMADLIARIIKYNKQELDSFLGELSIQNVTYQSVENNINIENQIKFNYQLLQLINEHRTNNGKEKLSINTNLSLASLHHSRFMASEKKLSHSDNEGLTHLGRCELYEEKCFAENVAVHSSPTAQHFFDLWVNSESHNKNMLGNYKEIGIGLSGQYVTNVFK